MAEIVVGAVVTMLMDKLISGELISFAQSAGIKSQLKKWRRKLSFIKAVLADAGQKEITQTDVRLWLLELQELAYDIDDVLDDIATEIIKRKLNQEESHGSTSRVMKIIPACCTNFTPHNFKYGRAIRSRLDEISTRLQDLLQQKKDLGLNVEIASITNNPLEQTSLVSESMILGRERDKQDLLRQLLGDEASNCHSPKVVPIVGPGGVGKTTLAKVLYNDDQVTGHFNLRVWVYVSHEFDVFHVSKVIYQAAYGESRDFANLDLLHVALKNKLSNKRFLLVLDDVWDEDGTKWEVLKQPLVGAPGSRVIVTTQNDMVTSVMNSVQPHNLEVLSDDIALSLLALYALNEQNFDNHPSLASIAQRIVRKCGGLPLALVTLGRVLKIKGTDDVKWQELLESEIWSSHDGSGILPALKLSYYHLPSHLKQVFAYCSMLPKDCAFEKNKLILLWMAQGFLSQSRDSIQPMESLGGKYFEHLLSRSFFQPLKNDESQYIMHDLMNDLAKSVAGEFSFRLDENTVLNANYEAYEKFRHFSFIRQQRVVEYTTFMELHRARCLRTFSLSGGWRGFDNNNSTVTLDNVTEELVPRLRFLRVLSLTNDSITKVPQSIGHLKHLRYLNFSETDIPQIPKEVSTLYNLQSLLARGCRNLSSMPVSFVKLINLRHIDMAGTPLLENIPSGIGGLTSLQTLSKVVIQENNGFKLSELNGLSDLHGELSIEGLEKVIDPTEAQNANLQQNNGLDDLQLVWRGDLRKPTNEDDVIEKLRPHCKLKKLRIVGYGGIKFPNWMGDPSFDQLTELVLIECKYCRELPTLEHLTSLRKLEIKKCSDLESIKGENSIMRSLRQVKVEKCDALKSYCCPNNVERLEITSCDSITSLSFSKLHEDLPSSSSSSSSSNLKILEVKYCNNMNSISKEHLPSLTSLEEMCIHECLSMEDSFPSCGLWPPNLRKLVIGELKKPMSDWGHQNYPSSLVELGLYGKNSGVISFGMEKQQDHNKQSSSCFLLPPSLTELRIVKFEEVDQSVSELLPHLPHLRYLELWDSPKLRDVPETTSSLRVNVYVTEKEQELNLA